MPSSTLTNDNLSLGVTNNDNSIPLTDFASLLQNKQPYGIYDATNFDSVKYIIPNNIGNGKDASVYGNISVEEEMGNGANVTIPYIRGFNTTTVQWPTCSLAGEFTICSITRYVDGNANTILHDSANQIIHGHYKGTTGYVKYGKEISNPKSTGTNTNWTVCCATSKGAQSGNVLVNGSPSGTDDNSSIPSGITGNSLMINGPSNNGFSSSDTSNFALAYVIIWNQALTTNELQIVSNALQNYLQTGNISTINSSGGITSISNPDTTNKNIMLDEGKIQYVNDRQIYANQVIKDEEKRLQDKKNSIDTGLSGQQRMIQINNNYNKRYQAFTQILYLYIIALAIYISFILFDKMAFSLSGGLINKLAILLIFTCIIYSFYIYYTVYTRDPMDYDKLALLDPEPSKATNGSGTAIVGSAPKVIFAGADQCVDGLCCSAGTEWNMSLGKCEPKLVFK